VIVAAGSSSRMKGTDKIFYDLGGKPLVAHTITAFQNNDHISEIVVVTRQDLIEQMWDVCKKYGLSKVVSVTAGGTTRTQSVMNGLDEVSKATLYAAVHDGARPFVTQEIISTTIEKAMKYHAAAPAIPVKDTIKVANNHIILSTPDRSSLYAVQTPQIFDFDLLRGALTKALSENTPVTDDCSAVEALGMSVFLTEGSDENIKVTTPTDLMLANAILEGRK